MLLLVFVVSFVVTYNNGRGKVPAMGWNHWNLFDCNITEDIILEQMRGLKKYKLDEYGYKFVNIDECWASTKRDENDVIISDPETFPHGIPYLVEKIHAEGLKIGIYTAIGYDTCRRRMGSWGYFDIDAATYAKWSVDYVKIDWCFVTEECKAHPAYYYGKFSEALNKTGHHFLLSLCNGGRDTCWEWSPEISNSWRTTQDIKSTWGHVLFNLDINKELASYAGQYNYNDPDMLEVGVRHVTSHGDVWELEMVENYAHFSLWVIMAAPLLLGNNLTFIPPEILDVITNEEVIAINQDEAGVQGWVVKEVKKNFDDEGHCLNLPTEKCVFTWLWKKPLTGNRLALLHFNRAAPGLRNPHFNENEQIEALWTDLGLEPGSKYRVRDVWAKKDMGEFQDSYTSPSVPQHGVHMVVLTPVKKADK